MAVAAERKTGRGQAPREAPPARVERRLRLGGVEVTLATTPQRAARLRRSPLYRHLLRPVLTRVGRRGAAGASPPPLGLLPAAPAAHPGDGSPAAAALWERVARIRWYHTIELPHGVVTPGFVDRRSVVDRYGIPADLRGLRCLDVGTWDGFWAFEMEKRGAAEVVALDVDSPFDLDFPRRQKALLRRQGDAGLRAAGIETIGSGFRLAHGVLGSRVRREALPIYDLSAERLGRFDLVFVSEVLEHLRDPQTALENLYDVTRGTVLVAEPYSPDLERFGRTLSRFVGTSKLGIWWEHSPQALHKLIGVAGFVEVQEVTRLAMDNRLGSFAKLVVRARAGGVPDAGGGG